MKKIKAAILTLLTLIIISITLTGCYNHNLPVYEKTEEDGTSVYIDGVRYKELPRLEWDISNVDKVIGYAGSYDTVIIGLKNDPNRDFIILKGFLQDYYGPGLYRTDKVIPEVSVENVDKIVWEDYEVDLETYGKLNHHTNTVEDKTTITELFDLLETGEEARNVNSAKKDSRNYIMRFYLYCSEIPAASYALRIALDNGRIICSRIATGYVYMPDDLLEKIAGKKIDISELTED